MSGHEEALPMRSSGGGKKRKRPTAHDVARLAGVAQSTVSYVLNDVQTVTITPETRTRVLDAVKQLGYVPNTAAAQLRIGRTDTIALISDEIATTPFAGKIIKGAQDYAWEQNKILTIINTENNASMVDAAIDIVLKRRVDGIIYATMHHLCVEVPASLREVPTVLLDCYCADRSLPSVVPDEVGGGYTATQVLLAKGHRRLGFINLQVDLPASRGRLVGYRKALEAAGVPFDPALVRNGNSRADSGYMLAHELMALADPPTALFCGNDNVAMGVYDALRDLKKTIPADVAVVGFDNQEIIAAYLRPGLTTLELPHYEMGQWAVRYLLERPNEDGGPVQATLPCPLIIRDST